MLEVTSVYNIWLEFWRDREADPRGLVGCKRWGVSGYHSHRRRGLGTGPSPHALRRIEVFACKGVLS